MTSSPSPRQPKQFDDSHEKYLRSSSYGVHMWHPPTDQSLALGKDLSSMLS